MARRATSRFLLAISAWLVAAGCASSRGGDERPAVVPEPVAPSTAPPTAAASEVDATAEAESGAVAEDGDPRTEAPAPTETEGRRGRIRLTEAERERVRAAGPCNPAPPLDEPALEATRRRLYRTVCGAVVWFDGLFGERRDVEIAQRTSGRLELSFIESEYRGFKTRIRFNARLKFPNLEERLEAFVGRDDEDQFIEDRPEGFGLRTQFHSFEENDDWIAGLGYGLPGTYARRTDFRVGGKGGRTPEIFAQGRHRRNWFIGDRALLHFRETLFWTNRDGFGTTTSLDFDRIVTPDVLFRIGGVGTFSEETDGLDYRLVGVVYHNLSASGRAIAYEIFARGETDDDVPTNEFGLRTVFRRPIFGRPWLFGELIAGYSWIREHEYESRQGSYSIGFGIDLLFGNRPY